MSKKSLSQLHPRERQIMDIIYQIGEAAATDIQKLLTGKPSNSTVRTKLRVLEKKGYVKKKEKNFRYIYFPTIPREKVKLSVLKHLINTLFDGSPERVVATILNSEDINFTNKELDRISSLIKQAKKEEK